jgi:hypothetical protein
VLLVEINIEQEKTKGKAGRVVHGGILVFGLGEEGHK